MNNSVLRQPIETNKKVISRASTKNRNLSTEEGPENIGGPGFLLEKKKVRTHSDTHTYQITTRHLFLPLPPHLFQPNTMKVGELLGRQDDKVKMSEGKRSLEDTMASSSDDDDEDHSRLSSLSDSTGDDLTSIGDEDSEDMERFERSLRQKHAKACKAMAVRKNMEYNSRLIHDSKIVAQGSLFFYCLLRLLSLLSSPPLVATEWSIRYCLARI